MATQQREVIERTGPCRVCGFDPDGLATTDAPVAARSIARRWRELFDHAGQDDGAHSLLHQRAPSGWSAVERAAHVAEVFGRKAERLRQVWERETPPLDEVGIDAARADTGAADPSDTVAAVAADAEHLARVLERYEDGGWDRIGIRRGQPVNAVQLAREAIHEGAHHLRLCEHDIEALAGEALDTDDEETA